MAWVEDGEGMICGVYVCVCVCVCVFISVLVPVEDVSMRSDLCFGCPFFSSFFCTPCCW